MTHDRGLAARAAQIGFYDRAEYRALHADLETVDLDAHYAEHGVWEARAGALPHTVTAGVARAVASTPDRSPLDQGSLERAYRRAVAGPVTIIAPPSPDLAEGAAIAGVARAIEAAGGDVKIVPSSDDPQSGDIIVAPARATASWTREAIVSALPEVLVVAVRDAFSESFLRDLGHVLSARAAIVSEPTSAAVLRTASVPVATFTPAITARGDAPPDHPLVAGLSRAARAWPADGAWSDRPIQLAWIEAATASRRAAWAVLAAPLAGREIVAYWPAEQGDGAAREACEAALRHYVFSRSRIVLHLHGSARPGPPDMALLRDVAESGAVLLCEAAAPAPSPFFAGVHYVQARTSRLPQAIADILQRERTPAPLAAETRALRDALGAYDPEDEGLRILHLLGELPA